MKKYEKVEMVIDKLPHYQEFEQVLGDIAPVNESLKSKKKKKIFLHFFFTNVYK